jgi:1-acyl-sn-glycerol-3-phosphate acyltransferase
MKPLDYFFDTPVADFPRRFSTFFFAVERLIFKLLFRYRAYDKEKLDSVAPGTGFIVAGNHSSYLDPVFVMNVMLPRRIRYLSKEEFLNIHPIVAHFAAWMGVFPVKRNTADMSAVKRAVRMLKRGENVGIFPEGTRVRSKDQEVINHEGIALIAKLANAPVVPVRIFNANKIRPEGTRLFRCPKIILRFGDPLSLEDERFASLPKEQRHQAFTDAVMKSVYALECPHP